jgi:hypothetical protein
MISTHFHKAEPIDVLKLKPGEAVCCQVGSDWVPATVVGTLIDASDSSEAASCDTVALVIDGCYDAIQIPATEVRALTGSCRAPGPEPGPVLTRQWSALETRVQEGDEGGVTRRSEAPVLSAELEPEPETVPVSHSELEPEPEPEPESEPELEPDSPSTAQRQGPELITRLMPLSAAPIQPALQVSLVMVGRVESVARTQAGERVTEENVRAVLAI